MEFIERIKKRAAEKNCRIVLPESYDTRITAAALQIAREGFARILLLSDGEWTFLMLYFTLFLLMVHTSIS